VADQRLRKKCFAPPRQGDKFRKYWERMLPKIVNRTNFHESHLFNLEVLCSLYVDYEIITDYFDLMGVDGLITVSEGGRNGPQEKHSILALRRDRLLGDIIRYTKILGLVLAKDVDADDEEEENEFQ
jgi:hypothetical protein